MPLLWNKDQQSGKVSGQSILWKQANFRSPVNLINQFIFINFSDQKYLENLMIAVVPVLII